MAWVAMMKIGQRMSICKIMNRICERVTGMMADRNEKFERGLDDFLRGGRDFKIGDYAVDKFGSVFHATDRSERDILNQNKEKWGFRQAAESEIEEYHKMILED